jgi:ligand-binding sensor domain-containing protein/putative methionine-R-sulfoxide reductase with GAF domain
LKKIIAVGFCLFFGLLISAQDISFFHLNTGNGLSDNEISSVVRDKNGLLWVTTVEGLNCYDGYTVKKFYKEDYPALGSNNLAGIICDKKNRLWVRSVGGIVTMIDEKRNMMKVPVLDSGKEVTPSFIRQTTARGIILFKGEKLYTLHETDSISFQRLQWKEDTALRHSFVQIVNDGNDILLMSGNNRLCIFDATQLKVLQTLVIPGIIGASRISADELLITTERDYELLRYSLSKQKVIVNYGQLKDQYGERIKGNLRHIRRMNDDRFIITATNGGVYVFDAVKEILLRYRYDVLNNRSISSNNTVYVHTDSSGYVYVTSRTSGLNYFNSSYQPASYLSSFRENSTGEIFRGYINCITQHPDGNFWLGSQKGLIEWNRERNITRFHDYGMNGGMPMKDIEEVRRLCFDKNDRLWVGLQRYGIVVLNKERKVIKYIDAGSITSRQHLPGNGINGIVLSPDNKLWTATSGGLCIIDPVSFDVNRLKEDELLKPLGTTYCYGVWFRNTNEVWIATNKGAYRYRIIEKKLTVFNTENGLSGNTVICFTDDNAGNVYAGTYTGLSVIRNDKVVKIYRRNNGLRSDRCQGFLKDMEGNIWIGNDNALLCYKPADSSFYAYDESHGLSPLGFRLHACHQTPSGQQFWGSDIGLSYFIPEQLQKIRLPLQANIISVNAGGQNYFFSSEERINVPYTKNNLQFSFSAVDLFGSKNILFEYRLSGADKDWQKTPSPQQVSYSSLAPGHYTFRVRASRDGINWVEASNPATIHIITPWWKSRWFILLCIASVAVSGFLFIRNRNKKIQLQKEQLETEQAINYFASSIYQQQTVDAILWDVTKNCIGRLQFEDCVIYLKEDNKNMLLQKAAWGPKTTEEHKIINPMEIPFGKGITGFVAQTGKAEIVNDTSKDGRYIVDDTRRFSEITVPILHDGKVLGIIDSEHPKKNFFTQRHLSILTTIASLCANKIVRVKAELEKQQAQLELLNHQRKVAEAQLKSLRLQMNPHFLFNSLNSIQQIILAGDESAATLYLSKFSRLLRMVLAHSDKERVTLKEELETLKLYVELESLRFKESFHHEIICDEAVDTDEIKIPTLLIQPFVENAIWHGLLHKEGDRSLLIKFTEDTTENIVCIVQDNGIGREASGKINTINNHVSKGIAVAEERLRTYNEQHTRKSNVLIEDLKDKYGNAAGTRVTITLPLLN